MKFLFDHYESGSYIKEGKPSIEMIISETKAKHQMYCQGVRECFMPGS